MAVLAKNGVRLVAFLTEAIFTINVNVQSNVVDALIFKMSQKQTVILPNMAQKIRNLFTENLIPPYNTHMTYMGIINDEVK